MKSTEQPNGCIGSALRLLGDLPGADPWEPVITCSSDTHLNNPWGLFGRQPRAAYELGAREVLRFACSARFLPFLVVLRAVLGGRRVSFVAI